MDHEVENRLMLMLNPALNLLFKYKRLIIPTGFSSESDWTPCD